MTPLKQKLEEHPGCVRNREKYLFVLHLVSRQLRRVYHDSRMAGNTVDINTWHCNLHSLYLRNAIGNDYNRIIEDLEIWGFIGRSRTYLVGTKSSPGKSKAFWFCKPYASYWDKYCFTREFRMSDTTGTMKKFGRTRPYMIKSKPFLKRLELCAADVKTHQLEDPRIRKCHDELTHFAIEEDRAEMLLREMVDSGKMTPKKMRLEMKKVERFNHIGKSNTALFVKKDRFGRIHTNVTQMKKEVRSECLTCDGHPTSSIDIKSSQGAFLGVILRAIVENHSFFDLRSSPTLCELQQKVKINDPEKYLLECDKYDSILKHGKLYEFFANELSEDCDIDRNIDRDEAKQAFFVFLYGPVNIENDQNELRAATRRVWVEHFPRLLCAIEQMKSTNYPALAREMQRIESFFVFDRLIPRVTREVGCPYCTVHDSLIVPEGLSHRVNDLANDELQLLSIPTMTVEEFRQHVVDKNVAQYNREVDLEMLGIANEPEFVFAAG